MPHANAPRGRVVSLAVVAAALMILQTGLSSHHLPRALAAAPPAIGVTQAGAPYDLSALSSFETDAGKSMALLNWYQGWGDNLQDATPYPNLLDAVTNHGATPMISWAPWDYRLTTINQPAYALRTIAAGAYDSYVRSWATILKTWEKPVLLRFAWEMNGDWMAWGVGINGNTTADFIAAWRHVHDIFTAVGATNVQWVWSPNYVATNEYPLETLYPGDAYVDWVALDGYNRVSAGWQSFTQIFGASYTRLTSLTNKPVMIGETSSSEAAPGASTSKAQWIQSALTQEIPQSFPRVRALLWYNVNMAGVEATGYDWRVESSSSAQSAFRAAVSGYSSSLTTTGLAPMTAPASTTCTSAYVSASPQNTAAQGATVTINAQSQGCSGVPQYKYSVYTAGTGWKLVQDYSNATSAQWNTAGYPAGAYQINVLVRSQSSTLDREADGNLSYMLTSPVAASICTGAYVSASPQNNAAVGATVTISAVASGCSGTPQYRFSVYTAATGWQLVQDYSGASSARWSTSTYPAGTYQLNVTVRSQSSTADREADSNLNYTLQ